MRDRLVAANQEMRWAPPEVGRGRFGNWLAGNVDWSLSRNRFWGTPLNVWVCDECGALEVPGSRADLVLKKLDRDPRLAFQIESGWRFLEPYLRRVPSFVV